MLTAIAIIQERIAMTKHITLLDGAMGTMLQDAGLPLGERPERYNLTHPEAIMGIHKRYVDAGSQVIYTNTFGANRHKLEGTGLDTQEVIASAVAIAKSAAGDKALVALDIGPIGELLSPNGTLSFESAYEIFREQVIAGARAGCDLIVLETMTDLYEVKAGILACKENSDLPVLVTMTFEPNGRTFTGATLESMAAVVEGLGADYIGINCSLGPAEIAPLVERLAKETSLPLVVKANAGLPNLETGTYDLSTEDYAAQAVALLEAGVAFIGGCCGTTPAYIAELKKAVDERGGKVEPRSVHPSATICCTPTVAVRRGTPHIVGERLNPTGKKRFQQALVDGDYDYLLRQALEQVDAKAHVLDVNVGHPGIDEVIVLPEVVTLLQSVLDTPLQIDTTHIDAMEAALRLYNGTPILNSVNGKADNLAQVLPLVKKYGASVVCLPLDEAGIPDTAQGRLAIAKRIVEAAKAHGIPKEKLIFDGLTMTVSAEPASGRVTLDTLDAIKSELGTLTTLGVSNISFGLPNRGLLNRTFLVLALEHGLDLAIINPNHRQMVEVLLAHNALSNKDPDMAEYIAWTASTEVEAPKTGSSTTLTLREAITRGLRSETRTLTKAYLIDHEPGDLVEKELIPALDEVGAEFEAGTTFLPQLINAATAAQEAFELLREKLASEKNDHVSKGKILIATVEGDIHDIGKNIVKVVLENYGYTIVDLGRDVPVQAVIDRAVAEDIQLIGLSALMTTTLESMNKTIIGLRRALPDAKIMVGGAVLTKKYALETLGADFFARNATANVHYAREFFQEDADDHS